MIFVILGICIVVIAIGCGMSNFYNTEDVSPIFIAIGVVACIVCLIAALILGITVSNHNVVDDKIAMYLEENTMIEEQVNILVDEYMEHESEVYSNAKVTSPVVLAQMYPEIKADDLIRSQIDIYVANNEQIKSLKLQKINGSVYRWWLYFGK